jgi:hypothetical protein
LFGAAAGFFRPEGWRCGSGYLGMGMASILVNFLHYKTKIEMMQAVSKN